MELRVDIHKAGGILLREGKFLIVRSKGKTMFYAPGGKLEPGESAPDALVRELSEELNISVRVEDLETFETFFADAAGAEDKRIRMDVFFVSKWEGEPVPSNEIDELLWIDSNVPGSVSLGSIFGHEVLPRLKEQGLLD